MESFEGLREGLIAPDIALMSGRVHRTRGVEGWTLPAQALERGPALRWRCRFSGNNLKLCNPCINYNILSVYPHIFDSAEFGKNTHAGEFASLEEVASDTRCSLGQLGSWTMR